MPIMNHTNARSLRTERPVPDSSEPNQSAIHSKRLLRPDLACLGSGLALACRESASGNWGPPGNSADSIQHSEAGSECIAGFRKLPVRGDRESACVAPLRCFSQRDLGLVTPESDHCTSSV